MMGVSEVLAGLRGYMDDPVLKFAAAKLALEHQSNPLVADYMTDHVGEGWEIWAQIMSSQAVQNTMADIRVESKMPRHIRVKVLGSHLVGDILPDPVVNPDGYGRDEPDGDEMWMHVTREEGDVFTFTCGLAPEPVLLPDWPPGLREAVERAHEAAELKSVELAAPVDGVRVRLAEPERQALIAAIKSYRAAIRTNTPETGFMAEEGAWPFSAESEDDRP